jgi:hypothetical protein
MRVYIIGNDGITLCREPPASVNEGEIVVALNEELHAAQLSSKRLLALWNALPGVAKRRKVGDREALIDQLWSAMSMESARCTPGRRRQRSSCPSFAMPAACGERRLPCRKKFTLRSPERCSMSSPSVA